MRRIVLFSVLAVSACAPQYAIIEDEEGVDTEEIVDEALYDGATLRIVQPASGSFLPLGEDHDFVAELIDIDGNPIDEVGPVTWSSTADDGWEPETELSFEDDSLDVGIHDITAQVRLPNGDRLAHTVGGILLQSPYAGTYAGTFSAEMVSDQYTIGCGGSAVLIVDPYGEVVGGDASCVTNLMGYEVELQFLFDLGNEEGDVEGTAAADLMGWYQLDFAAVGSVTEDGELELEFGGEGNSGGFLDVSGGLTADRVTRDASGQ